MTSEKIRQLKVVFEGDSPDMALQKTLVGIFNVLKESAAQLADLNHNFLRLTHPNESKLLDDIESGKVFPSEGFHRG